MSNVTYSFVNTEGSMVFRSTVNSFGLDHVTEKDMNSFYTSFSQYSYIDTGLLPVDGTGLLSLRSAGNHTQIAYQHKPGLYYINWGKYEGDATAKKYYVAQPYRIVIADILNGNLLGARTFYSPVPITHHQAPLYHVNLPNINCKGYRGNAVGWICLYHNADISSYPLSEKIAAILDRCSGTEAYNDQNMDETDGPRFYSSNFKPQYLWDPIQWEARSQELGYEWTLDPDLWIPVLVQDLDNQDRHCSTGVPLTFADAIVGNYQAYYTDTLIPKPVNAIARNEELPSDYAFNIFKIAYNAASVSSFPIDNYTKAESIREDNSLKAPTLSFSDEEEGEGFTWYCDDCSNGYDSESVPNTTYSSSYICDHCFEQYNYCVNTDKYHYYEHTLYLSHSDVHVYSEKKTNTPEYKWCCSCDEGIYHTHPDFDKFEYDYEKDLCTACVQQQQPADTTPF